VPLLYLSISSSTGTGTYLHILKLPFSPPAESQTDIENTLPIVPNKSRYSLISSNYNTGETRYLQKFEYFWRDSPTGNGLFAPGYRNDAWSRTRVDNNSLLIGPFRSHFFRRFRSVLYRDSSDLDVFRILVRCSLHSTDIVVVRDAWSWSRLDSVLSRASLGLVSNSSRSS